MAGCRTKLDDVRVTIKRNECEAEVDLGLHILNSYVKKTGRENGAAGEEINQLTLVAMATMKAIEQFYDELRWVVDGVVTFTVAQKRVVAALVTVVFPGLTRSNAGCSLVRADPYRACAQATLDAINRILCQFEPGADSAE